MFKKKFLPALLLGIASLGFVGCSGSDDTDDTQVTEVDFTKGEYKQKVLIEDVTSASCVWCPLGSFTIEELEKSNYKDKVIGVGVHGDFDPRNVKDPFVLPGINTLMNAVNLKGWPHLSFNRNPTITGTAFQTFIPKRSNEGVVQYTFDPNLFKNFYTKNKLFNEGGSPIGIKIESNLAATSGKVDVSLKFSQNINQELKYLVYVIEDGLVFQQANASTLYGNTTGQPRWEMNFVHDHVVRATNNFLGETIAAGQTTSSEFKATANLTYTVEDLSKVSVVVAVLDKDGNVVNAQKAKANTMQDYEKM